MTPGPGPRLAASQLSAAQLELVSLGLLWLFFRLAALFLVPHLACLAGWLINYQAGLVRDGLAGSLLLLGAALLGRAPADAVLMAQILCALALILACILLIRRPRPAPLLLVVALLSPAGLLFQVESVERGGKELILLALFGLLAWRSSRGKPAPSAWGLSAAFLLLTALQQELFFFAPAVLLLLRLLHPESRWRMRDLAWVLAPGAFFYAALALAAPCSPERLLRIISAVHGNPAALGPAMAPALGASLGQAARFAASELSSAKLWLTAAAAALACLPVALWLASSAAARSLLSPLLRDPAGWALALLTALFQLALMALDPAWGRWLSLGFLLAVLSLLAASTRLSPASPEAEARSSPWLLLLLLLALNAFSWRVEPRLRALSLSEAPEYLEALKPPIFYPTQIER